MSSDGSYFPRGGSVLRQVMDERCVGLLYGQRALCIGALKPLNYVGTAEHSHHTEMPFKRLSHTGEMFERVYFGTRDEADKTLSAVAGMHRRVEGALSADAGEHYPAGTPYSATDPELMLWTVAVMVDSADWFYEHLVRPLSAEEHEAFWQDWLRFLELFGCPRERAPQSWPAFRAWYAQQLAGDDLFLTDEARYIGYASAFEIPMPASRRLGKRGHDALMLHSLPPRVRELYGIQLSSAQAAFARAVLASHPPLRRMLPSWLAIGSCIAEFKMVARTEQRRIARGQYTPQVSRTPRRPRTRA